MALFQSSVCKHIAAVVALAFLSQNASALTADDVTKKMNHDQRFSYLTGLIDMLAYQTSVAGNRSKGDCIVGAFFREGKEASWNRLNEVLEKFGDKRAEILVSVLAEQLCKDK